MCCLGHALHLSTGSCSARRKDNVRHFLDPISRVWFLHCHPTPAILSCLLCSSSQHQYLCVSAIFFFFWICCAQWEARIAQWYSAGLRAGWSGGSSPGRGWKCFSSPDRLWGPPSLLSNGYQGFFPWGKAAGVWSWPLPFVWCWGQECMELCLHSANTPSWRGAQLKRSALTTLPLLFTMIFDPVVEKESGAQVWE
jgi:hypothetical protein